jgi:NitT/TauT family transport system substrate-binding protein
VSETPVRGRRTVIAAFGAAVALLAVSAAPGGASSGQLQTVTIATPPFEPTALSFYANARGLFRRHGIDARLVVTADPNAGVAAMLAGDAQFSATASGGVALLRSRGAPVRLVAAGALYLRTAPTAALVSARGKRFATPRELVGKRIGYDAPGTIANVALLKWLKQGGVRESDVTLVRASFPDQIGALARGDVDASVLPEPFLTVAKQQGARLVAPIFQSVCASACLLTTWIARSDVDRNLVARFRNAIQEAAAWANRERNDAASGAILARYAEIEPGLLRAMARSRFGTRLRLPRIQPWIDAYKEFGLIPEAFTVADLVK